MKPHVHAEVIKAWADGAEIEYRHEDCHEWREVIAGTPSWNPHTKYRVKPKAVVKYHAIMQGTNGYENMNHTTGYHADASYIRSNNTESWKVIAIVKTIFVDRVPVSVELVK